jgi:sugar lactone lactonase YvrE
MELIETIRVGNTLGEGVQWDAAAQTLWWTDIQEKRLHRYNWAAKTLETFAAPERIGSFGLIESSHLLIVAFASGVALWDPRGTTLRWLARPDAGTAGVRFNDGRVDRQGRFWAGTMEETEPRTGRGSLYCIDGNGRATRRESGVKIANGLCWSPDSTRLYFADSPSGEIHCYDFNAATGTIANRQLFARITDGAHPDGAATDSQGFVWSAHWGAGRVVRYTPDGTIDEVLEVPARQPTCVAFGGPALDLLFVTSARAGLTETERAAQPSAGDVFVYKIGYAGLPESRFILDAGIRRDVERS